MQQSVHPTTGILAVFVALNYCDVVHIAGFGYPSSKSQRQPIHYYGYDTMKSMKVGVSVCVVTRDVSARCLGSDAPLMLLCCRTLTTT